MTTFDDALRSIVSLVPCDAPESEHRAAAAKIQNVVARYQSFAYECEDHPMFPAILAAVAKQEHDLGFASAVLSAFMMGLTVGVEMERTETL